MESFGIESGGVELGWLGAWMGGWVSAMGWDGMGYVLECGMMSELGRDGI